MIGLASTRSAYDLVLSDLCAHLAPDLSPELEAEAALNVDPGPLEGSYRQFVAAAWSYVDPTPFVPTWHTDGVSDILQAVHTGDLLRVILSMPPGTGKTALSSVLFPAWEWGPADTPGLRYLNVSYGGSIHAPALRAADRSLSLIKSPWYQALWGSRFKLTKDGASYFANDKGGDRTSVGLDGAISGRADRAILDDVLKLGERLSRPALDHAINSWNDSIRSRLANDRASVVLVMQRLNVDDLAGYFEKRQKEDGWTVVRFPRFYEEKHKCRVFIHGELFFEDPRVREGEFLHPETIIKSRAKAEAERAEMGEWRWAAEEQQRPTPVGGGWIKLGWVQRWHERLSCGEPLGCPSCLPDIYEQLIQSWDCAFKKGSQNSWVVGQVWGRRGSRIYLLDQRRGHWDIVVTMSNLLSLTERWPACTAKLIEDKANGPAILQILGHEVPGLIAMPVTDSKEARVLAVQPFWQAMNVFIPADDYVGSADKMWVPDWVAEVTNFPAVVHNDQADAMSQAVWKLLGGSALTRDAVASVLALNTTAPPSQTRISPEVMTGGVGVKVGGNGNGNGNGHGGLAGGDGFDIDRLRRQFGR